MKPGYLTTEFWLAVGAKLIALCAILGFVNAGDAQSIGDAWAKGITGIFAVASAGAVAWKYIESRTALKKGGA